MCIRDRGSSAQKLLHSLLTMAGIYIIGVTAQYLQQRIMIGVSQGALEKILSLIHI